MVRVFVIAMVMFGMSHCGSDSDGDNQSSDGNSSNEESGGTSDDPNLQGWQSESEITASLTAGAYKEWASEDAVHQSAGAHGMVKTFINGVLKGAQDDGETIYPVGSIAVKELYESDRSTLKGYAAEIKLQEGDNVGNWLWYEDLNKDTSSVDFYGQNLSLCTNCHARGTDYVTTQLD